MGLFIGRRRRKEVNTMLNEFRFLGRLADNPTIAEKYTRFPLAVKQDKRGDAEAETDFFTMTCFGNTKKVVDEYMKEGKGKLVLVSGSVRNNRYEKDGEKKFDTSFIVDRLDFCDKA